MNWGFNAWAKYDNYARDAAGRRAVERSPGCRASSRRARTTAERVVLEGGGIETDGQGTLLVTEEWLLSDVQVRNPGLTRAGYERAFRDCARHPRDDLAGRGLRRRRHARARGRHRALRRAGRDRARVRGRPGRRREPSPLGRQPAPPRAAPARDGGALQVVKLPYPRAGDDGRRAAAGELRELLHRQRRRDRADVQRSATTASR